MAKDLKALRDARGRAVKDMRDLLDKAEAEKRSLTAEEQGQYDKLFGEQQRLGDDISREERQRELDREMAAGELERRDQARGGENRGENAGGTGRNSEEYRAAFRSYLLGGMTSLSAVDARALQADSNPAGGYLVAPQQFVDQLIKAVDDAVFIRGLATTFQVPMAQSIGVPSLDADPADSDWTSELRTGSEDSTMAFGKRELHPRPLAKRIKVSQKLLRAGMLQPEALVQRRLAYKFGITQEKAFLTGTGANQPLGIFTASNDGIPTTRDVSSGNTTTSMAFDGLINAKYSVKAAYWPAARWIFHRDGVKQISKLKDGDGQYLWRQSVREGEPDTLLGHPVMVSEYAPSTFTTGLYVGAFGDFSNYWIADAIDFQLQRLNELYAETNQVGFIGRMETDGAPVLAEAFARVTLA